MLISAGLYGETNFGIGMFLTALIKCSDTFPFQKKYLSPTEW